MTVQVNFTSHYDAPVRLAALLVNALTPGWERGRRRAHPNGEQEREAATEALRSIEPELATIGAPDAARLAEWSLAMRAVFAAVASGDLDTAAGQVEQMLERTATRPSMARHDEQLWHVHYGGTAGGAAGHWAGTCAAALGIVLGSDARARLGVCTAERCDRVYVDSSHNGTRRFCSTACQNRVKAAAFRTRNHPGPPGPHNPTGPSDASARHRPSRSRAGSPDGGRVAPE